MNRRKVWSHAERSAAPIAWFKAIATYRDGRSFAPKEDMEKILSNFLPPVYPHAIELQNLLGERD